MGIPGGNSSKTLLIGCSGSVACIKIPEILDLLQRRFPEMKIVVIPTVHAGHFLPTDRTGHIVPFLPHDLISVVDPLQCGLEDFETLAEKAVAFLVAPLGANLMAKLAKPCLLQSSNLETALQDFLRYRGGRELPLLLAPAMNSMMWNSVITVKNMETIRLLYGSDGGVTFIPTANKPSVCGETGFGPMASPINIVEYLENALTGRPVSVQKDNIVAAPVPVLHTILPSRSRQSETDEALDCPRSSQLCRRYSRDAPGYRHCLQMLIHEHKDSFDDLHILIGASYISDGSSVAQLTDTLGDFKMNIKKRFTDKFMADLQKLNKEQYLLDHITESMNLQESRIVLKYIATDNIRKQSPQNFEPGQNLMNMDFFSDTDEWRVWKKREDPVLHILLRQWADGMLLLNPTELLLQKIAAGVCDDLLTCVIRAWDYSQNVIFALFDEDGRSVLEQISLQQSEEFRQRGVQLIWINS